MGSKKKNKSAIKSQTPSTPHHIPLLQLDDVPRHVLQSLGAPFLAAEQTAHSSQVCAASAVLSACPEQLSKGALARHEVCLSPPLPQQLLSLWEWYSRQQGWSLSKAPLPLLGSYVWPARVQPDAALVVGTCCLSGNLIKGLHSLGQDSCLGLYKASQPVALQAGVEKQGSKQIVYMRLMLDQNTGLPAVVLQQSAAKAATKATSPASSWALRALKQNSSKQTHMLESLLMQHLQKQLLLPGNPIIVPVLGHCCVYRVEHIISDAAENVATIVDEKTEVHVLQPDEALPRQALSAPPKTASQAKETIAPPERDIVAEARAAAAASDEEEGMEGAAARAAARAASLGLAAASTGYASLGGVDDHVKALRELVTLPLKFPHLFARYNMRPPRGVLLWGPPGTGKTCLARGAAAEVGVPLFVINGPDVVSELYGESEASLQGIFTAAHALAPSVIFIDELDVLAPARGGGDSVGGGGGGMAPEPAAEMCDRIVSSLLTAMDGINTHSASTGGAGVVVIAATNRPEALDSALRRPGRFDRELEVGVPSPAARAHILRAKLKAVRHCLAEEDIDALAAAAHGFVGADLTAICDEAAMAALRRVIAARRSPPAVQTPGSKQPQHELQGPSHRGKQMGEQWQTSSHQISQDVQAVTQATDAHSSQQQSIAAIKPQARQQHWDAAQQSAGMPASLGEDMLQPASHDSHLALQGLSQDISMLQMTEVEQVRVCANAEDLSGQGRQAVPGEDAAASPTVVSSSAQVGQAEIQVETDTSRKVNLHPDRADPCAGEAGLQGSKTEQSEEGELQGGKAELQAGKAELVITLADFRVAETRVRPSAMREVALEVPKVRWGDVGGLDGVKQRLQEAVQWPHLHPEALARLGAQPPKGVLLYGPPGCSKTLLARAVANEAKLNFLAVKGPELFSKYVGQAEKAVAALFARARAAAPAIIFFDEIDGLAGARGGEGGSGVGERVLSQLLMEMDGLQARVGVVVVGATNRPDCVDAALLRPGRFDRLLFVPPPDAAARQAILVVHTRNTPLASDVHLQALAERSEGFTGADLAALVREAALAALTENLQATAVNQDHFSKAFQAVSKSTPPSQAMQQVYFKFNRHGST
ncbi:hypothetical protein WJX77_000494 [Trebouxia sp. C0004]